MKLSISIFFAETALYFIALSLMNFAVAEDRDTLNVVKIARCSEINTGIKIYNVNVIPMDKERILPHQTVIVQHGKVFSLSRSHQSVHELKSLDSKGCPFRVVDGSDKYLMPGLIDMHVHLPGNSNVPWFKNNGVDDIEDTLFLMLANGVTTVRSMLGEPSIFDIKKKVASGVFLGPEIFTASPSIDGNSVRSPEDASAKVIEYKHNGYDFLKLRPGLTREEFTAVTTTAKEYDIDFSGHISRSVGIEASLASGYSSIEHLDGYVEAMLPKSFEKESVPYGIFGYTYAPFVELGRLEFLLEETKKNKVWITPTENMLETWALTLEEKNSTYEEIKYLPKRIREQWKNEFENPLMKKFSANSEYFFSLRRLIIKEMQNKGVRLLMGSDSPQLYSVPGFAARREIKTLTQCGMTPYQALAAATINPAEFLGRQKVLGKIAKGFFANMILLNSNPLKEIDNIYDISGIFVKGIWISRNKIEERLSKISSKYVEFL